MATGTLKPGFLPAAGEQEESGVDLLSVTAALLTEWRLGAIAFLVTLAIATGAIFALKPQYVATAVILPENGHAEMNSLSSLFTLQRPGGMYIGLLKSRSVQEEVVERAGLLKLWNTSSHESARNILSGKSKFVEDPDTLVTISVKDKNSATAALIANAYLDALKNLNSRMSLQQSTETGQFFKVQLQEERGELAGAETQLESTQRRTGVVQPEMQTSLGLNAIAQVRAQITQTQVQLAALLRGATEENPQVQRLQSQLAQLQAQERILEQGRGPSPAGAAPAAQQLPATNLDVLRAQREVTYHNALVTSLANQFEAARLMEASSRSEFQVVDRAIAPERKAWPPRIPFLAAAVVLAGIMGLLAMVLRLMWRLMERDPEHHERMARLRRAARAR